jgi:hypothetical protein
MKKIKGLSHYKLQHLIGHTVRFISDCEMFPHFNVTGRVVSITTHKSEPIIEIIEKRYHKRITISGHMKNLRYETED